MHCNQMVHRDIKLDNVFLTEDSLEADVRLGDYGTARMVNENDDFVPEKNESINQTVAGSGFYMSPEMKNEKPNGTKTDVWSFGILIGVMYGLEDVCPPGYRGGIPQFIKNCASGKHDLVLHKSDIHLSPIAKDLLKGCLSVDTNKRFTMHQVVHHKYCSLDLNQYKIGYNNWA